MSIEQNLAEFKNGERISSVGYAVFNKDDNFKQFTFSRHPIGANDILIEILYAGICHSDIHSVKEEWHAGMFPMVPGHEIAGRVVAVGKNVTKFKVGELAGVGCMINSCGECDACKKSLEQYCENGKTVFTYDNKDIFHDNEPAYGGYSSNIVVSEKFAIKVPENAPLDKVAPLLCAGITTYSPLRFSNVKQGDKVAIAGFGGLGLMAVKYALKMGAEVYVFARNNLKEEYAKSIGVTKLFTSTENVDVKFDLLISTIPNNYKAVEYLRHLKIGGEMAVLGVPPTEFHANIEVAELIFNAHKKIYGSLIGGIAQTQEMLDFSIEHEIYPEIEVIKPSQIDEAYENLTTGKAKFRYVIDMKS